jgi:hypothetical protein
MVDFLVSSCGQATRLVGGCGGEDIPALVPPRGMQERAPRRVSSVSPRAESSSEPLAAGKPMEPRIEVGRVVAIARAHASISSGRAARRGVAAAAFPASEAFSPRPIRVLPEFRRPLSDR